MDFGLKRLWSKLSTKASQVIDYPSITKQTKWKSGFFHFGKAQADSAVRFFNPSLIHHKGSDWLITRKAQSTNGDRFGMNSIWAFKLDEGHRPLQGIKVEFKNRYRFQHHEDPRIVRLDSGKMLLSFTTFVIEPTKGWYGAHQGCAVLNDVFQPEQLLDPVYGRNGGSVLMNRGSEKNWLWFMHGGELHMIYETAPVHEVVRFTGNLGVVRVYKTKEHEGIFSKWGQPRGGTPPVLVNGEYWSFFHSSIPWKNEKRRYFMGAYAFEANPPFRVTRMTTKPLLAGSQNDPWEEGQPLVVFPCGAIHRNGLWFVSMGINDMASAWIEIPHGDLYRLTKPINEDVPVVEKVFAHTEAEVEARKAEPEPYLQQNIATVEAGPSLNGVAITTAVSTTNAGAVGDLVRPVPKQRRPIGRRIRRRHSAGIRSD